MQQYLEENPIDPELDYVKFSASKQLPKNPDLKYFQYGYTAILLRTILKLSGFSVTKHRKEAILIVGNAMDGQEYSKLTNLQKTNHLQKTSSLGSKEGFNEVMKNFFKQIGKSLPFYPETYHLPLEYNELAKAFPTSKLWISKPAAGSRGIGINVIDKMPKTKENIVVQKYIDRPMLIHSLKFDLRFYVAVTSIDPLIVFVYDNGLVRLATQPYEESLNDLSNQAAHLTNFSINKNMKGFVATNDISKDGTGNKWSHHPFWPYLKEHGFDPDEIRNRIDDAIAQTIIAAVRTFRIQRNSSVSYELFGFDVMLDEDANVYILEVNISPAMGTSSELDRVIKTPLNLDLFNMINLPMPGSKVSALDTYGNLNAGRYVLLHQYEETLAKRGGFRPIFPTKERVGFYDMMYMTDDDETLAKYVVLDEKERIEMIEKYRESYKSFMENKEKDKKL